MPSIVSHLALSTCGVAAGCAGDPANPHGGDLPPGEPGRRRRWRRCGASAHDRSVCRHAYAIAEHGSTTVVASFRLGGAAAAFVAWTGGEVVRAHMVSGASSATKEMERVSVLGATYYEADFLIDLEDTELTIERDRSSTGQSGAPDSVATLPAPFSITGPPANTAFSRTADTVSVQWEPHGSGDEMAYEIIGTCIQPVSAATDDDGSFDIGPNDLQSAQPKANGFLIGKRYLLCDRDPLFTKEFRDILGSVGVQTVWLPLGRGPARCRRCKE